MMLNSTFTSIQPRWSARSVLCESIARHAFAHWVRDGRPAGAALRYWLEAELRVLTEHAVRSTRPTPGRPHRSIA